jgi:hypothetical protein
MSQLRFECGLVVLTGRIIPTTGCDAIYFFAATGFRDRKGTPNQQIEKSVFKLCC